MSYNPHELADMLRTRTTHPDPTLAAVEAVLLRAALERLDDFIYWLDEHTSREHPDIAEATAVVLDTVHHRLSAEVAHVDAAIVRIEE